MVRASSLLVALVALLPAQTVPLALTEHGAFFAPAGAGPADSTVLARLGDVVIDAGMFARYRAASGHDDVAELAFDLALVRACAERGLAHSAPTLARAMGRRRLVESGRSEDDPAAPSFVNDALRRLRVDALVREQRLADEGALRDLFDRRFGVDGHRVEVRQILVSYRAEQQRSSGDPQAAALARAGALRARIAAGESFATLLGESDDRLTRRMLRDGDAAAGTIEGYNYRRYGEEFAAAVRALQVGEVSAPVTSPVGVHLIELVARRITALADVADALRAELALGSAKPLEVQRLRERLLATQHFEPAATQDPAPAAWPIHRGDRGLSGAVAGDIGERPEPLWTFPTEGPITSSPVIGDGLVYVGSSDQNVYAVDLATGEERWRLATGDLVEAPPLVLEGRVYVGSCDFWFYALDAATGEVAWKVETGDKIMGSANWARGADGRLRVLVGSYDTYLYCFDAATGDQLWRYETANYVNGTPAIWRDHAVFGGCDAVLHVVSIETGEAAAQVALGADAHVAGSVGIAGDRVYFGHYGNEFVCVDLTTEELVWRYPSLRHAFFASPAIGQDRVVFGGRDKSIHCVRRDTGEVLWTVATGRKVDGSPLLVGDKVICGSGDGRLYLLAAADGRELWRGDLGRSVYSSPAIAGDVIVIGSGDGGLHAFRAEVKR